MPRTAYAGGLTKECGNVGCTERFRFPQDKTMHQNHRCPYRPVHRPRSIEAPAVEGQIACPFGDGIRWTDEELFTLSFTVKNLL